MRLKLKFIIIYIASLFILGCGYVSKYEYVSYANGVFKVDEISKMRIIEIDIKEKKEIVSLYKWQCLNLPTDCSIFSIRSILDSLEQKHDTLFITMKTGIIKNNVIDVLNKFRLISIKTQKKDSTILLKPERY